MTDKCPNCGELITEENPLYEEWEGILVQACKACVGEVEEQCYNCGSLVMGNMFHECTASVSGEIMHCPDCE